jgi:hypothetical protein
MTNLMNTHLEKLIDLILYDFLTTSVSNSNRFCSLIDDNYTFWSNQKRVHAVFKDKHLFLPVTHVYNTKVFENNKSCNNLQPFNFFMSRIQPTSIYTKDSFLILKTRLRDQDITIVFYIDLIHNVFDT